MRTMLLMLGIAAGCGHRPSDSPAPVEAPPAASPLLSLVGPAPRGFAILSLAEPQLHEQLVDLEAGLRDQLGKSLGDCGVALAGLERIRVAIGEPLRIAAELDGKIDVHAVTCLVGDAAMAILARNGLVIRERPAGIAIDYQAQHVQAARTRDVGNELARRCADASCAAVVLGPLGGRLWIELQLGKTLRLQLSGPNVAHGAAAVVAAIDSLRAATPALRLLAVREQQGALVIELPRDPPLASMIALALTLRAQLLEAFKLPSTSMVPSLLAGDQFFVAKGPLLGEPVPGDILVYQQDTKAWVKRYLAGPGQMVTETEAGIAIDGTPLVTEVVDPGYHYQDRDETTDRVVDRSGALVREHLGPRSYLTLRTGPPRNGTWTVPPGHVFFLGDNRNNSNDSRYLGASPKEAIVGRVIGTWLAFRNGVIDWDRMGILIE